MRKINTGYFAALFTMFLWGSLYVMNGVALKTLNAFELSFFRFFGAVIALFILLKITKTDMSVRKEDWKTIWIIGFLGYWATIVATMLAIAEVGSVLSSLVISLNPLGIMLAASIMLKEKITIRQIILICIALGGVVIVSSGGGGRMTVPGLCFCFMSIGFWAVAASLIRKIGGHYPPFVLTFWGMLCSLAFHIPTELICIAVKGLPVINGATLGAIFYVAVIGTALAQSMWNIALSHLPASVCSMFYPIQSLCAAVLGVIVLDETISLRLVIGGIIISAAIVTNFLPAKQKKETPPASE